MYGSNQEALRKRLRKNLANNHNIREALTRNGDRALSYNTRPVGMKTSFRGSVMSNPKSRPRNSKLILDTHSGSRDNSRQRNKINLNGNEVNINITTV